MKVAVVYLTKESYNTRDDDYYCSVNLGKVIEKAGLTVKYTAPTEFEAVFKNNKVDLLAFPGSDKDVDELFSELTVVDCTSIRKFIQSGGRYMGVCMGSFLASSKYFNLIKSKPFNERRNMQRAQLATLIFNGSIRNVYIESPPDFTSINKNDVRIISTYNGSEGCRDIDMFIKDRILLSSSHFEATPDWSDKFKIPDNSDIGVYAIQELLKK
jgi:glutamine amidotransferase-like uncharacterized protein